MNPLSNTIKDLTTTIMIGDARFYSENSDGAIPFSLEIMEATLDEGFGQHI